MSAPSSITLESNQSCVVIKIEVGTLQSDHTAAIRVGVCLGVLLLLAMIGYILTLLTDESKPDQANVDDRDEQVKEVNSPNAGEEKRESRTPAVVPDHDLYQADSDSMSSAAGRSAARPSADVANGRMQRMYAN